MAVFTLIVECMLFNAKIKDWLVFSFPESLSSCILGKSRILRSPEHEIYKWASDRSNDRKWQLLH